MGRGINHNDKVTCSLQPESHSSCHASAACKLLHLLPKEIKVQALHANSYSQGGWLNFKGLQQIKGLHAAVLTSLFYYLSGGM